MSFRAWLSLITIVLLALVLFASRHELVSAWHLLGQVNLWVLALMIPLQVVAYFAGGEMIFSYLREKKFIKNVKQRELVKVALEGNFVNHVLPSGGVSGISYLTWRLKQLGVSPGRATMAQAVRHVMSFVSYTVVLLIALFVVTIDGTINRWMILASAGLFGTIVLAILGLVYLLSSKRRIDKFSSWIANFANNFVRSITFGRYTKVVNVGTIEEFLGEMHKDFSELREDKRVLIKPFLWGLLFNICDAGLFLLAFWSFGEFFNPAPIFIAYGVASIVGFVVLTPGGAGAYEAVMVTFLAFAGIAGKVAIAGILLARVVILLGTICFGYIFYQMALNKYGGKRDTKV